MLSLLSAVLIWSSWQGSRAQCSVEIRRDCHPWPNADQSSCEARGCSWCPAEPEVPWCVYSDDVCPSEIDEAAREDCQETDKPSCNRRGCVWCPAQDPNAPWCFWDPLASQGGDFCPSIPDARRVDCHPEPGANVETCIARGCYWCPTSSQGVPHCVAAPQNTYTVRGSEDILNGMRYFLHRGPLPSWFGGDVRDIALDVVMQSDHSVSLQFLDPNRERFRVPIQLPSGGAAAPLYEVEVSEENEPFSVKVIRKDTADVLFDSALGPLVYSDQFLQLSTFLDSSVVFGFGERERTELANNMSFYNIAMYSRDQAVTASNLYGAQPYYVNVERSGSAHSVLLLNSNAQEVMLMPAPGYTYRTTGGIIELHFFLGPTVDLVYRQYALAVGLPPLPPYWALGFQLCRWGYNNTDHIRQVASRMRNYDIPHDIQYADIDYMDGAKDFTLNAENFGDLPELVGQLKAEGTRFLVILDPAISSDHPPGEYRTLDEGNLLDVWIKNSDGSAPIKGRVWPGSTFFPDFFKNATLDWWTDENLRFRQILRFDSLWIDMNEPSNFVAGSVDGCANNRINNPPYVPDILDRSLFEKTICPDAQTEAGLLYDVHSLYGLAMSKQSFLAMEQVFEERGIVFSRSTYPGSGKYAQHWLGDNFSNWKNLRASVPGIIDFNMFAFPYVGPDICGFLDETSEQLCKRWHQVGAFYTFSRNHNHEANPDQDPGVWPEVARVTREVLHIRYSLLPYLYTLFYFAATTGSAVIRPLFYDYTADVATLAVNGQFMWGKALLITPVMDEGAQSIQGYFPDNRWFDLRQGSEVPHRKKYVVLDAPEDYIPLHVAGGSIVPTQLPANSTLFSRQNNMSLAAYPDDAGEASGSLFWDDGTSKRTVESGNFLLLEFELRQGSLASSVAVGGYLPSLNFHSALVHSLPVPVNSVTKDGEDWTDWDYDSVTGLLTVRSLDQPIAEPFQLSWN